MNNTVIEIVRGKSLSVYFDFLLVCLKSLLNFLQYCFCFMFCFWGHETCGILAPWPGIEPAPDALEGEVVTTGLPGKSLGADCFLPGIWIIRSESTKNFFWVGGVLQIAKEFSGKLCLTQSGPRSKEKVMVLKSDQKQHSVFYLVWGYLQAQMASVPLPWAEMLSGATSLAILSPDYSLSTWITLWWSHLGLVIFQEKSDQFRIYAVSST